MQKHDWYSDTDPKALEVFLDVAAVDDASAKRSKPYLS